MSLNLRTPGLGVLLTVALLSGCGEHDHAAEGTSGGGHHHGSAHGGVAVELGEHQYQLDFLADPDAGTLKAWVMDGHVENFVRVPLPSFDVVVLTATGTQTLSLVACANPASGETVGNTSQFEAEAPWLKGLGRFSATVPRVEIRGTTFTDVRFEYPGSP